MGGRGAATAAAAVWIGIVAGGWLGAPGVVAAMVLGLGAMALAGRVPGRCGGAALLISLLLAGAARGGAHRTVLERSREEVGESDRLYRLEGRIVEPPQRESGEPQVVLAVRAAHPALVAGSRLKLRLPPDARVEWSDEVEVLARLETPKSRRNPGGFDARSAAAAVDGIAAGRAYTVRARPARGLASWPRAFAARWRRAVDRRLAGLSPGARELVVPLVVGDRSALSPEVDAEMRAAGLIHLLALSGLHVAWMAAVARGIVAACGGATVARAAAGAACALFYVAIAGPIPSLMRAAGTEALRGLAIARALDSIQALALTALALLAVAPGWAADLGFQLSCAATLGLVALGPALSGEGRAPEWRRSLAATLGAQIVALPLLIGRFHALSWIAPIANLLAVPISGALLASAWLAIAIDVVAPGGGVLGFHACEALALALRTVTERAARVPVALVATGHHPLPVVLAAIGALLLVVAASPPRDLESRSRPRTRVRSLAIASGFATTAIALFTAVATPALRPPPGRLWLIALDVGQGDALALGFEDGWWLIDAGPRSPRHDAGQSVVLPFLRWAGVNALEALVFTHEDSDHIGGGPAVSKAVRVRRIWCPAPRPGVPGPSHRFGGDGASRGMRLRERPEVRVLWPPAGGVVDDAGKEIAIDTDNRASLVLEVEAGAQRVLLLADADSVVERALAVAPGVALIKAGHHGSGSSSGAVFLARTRPGAAILSCGLRNPFGHPNAGALARLAAAGASLHRTDREGAVWFEIGPQGVTRIDWRRGLGTRATRGPPGAPAPAAPRDP